MLSEALSLFSQFMEAGGDVLWVIFAVTLVLWSLIAERILFLKINYPNIKQQFVEVWQMRANQNSWNSLRVREQLISQVRSHLTQGIPLVKTLVALCPLLGLLGTVTGMIAVFDVMAVVGTGNARSMASGISMATIPTMAGMVASLSGIYFRSYLEKQSKLELDRFTDELVIR